LPSSLTRFLSRALVYSTFPPVSVLVRIPARLARSFSWQHGISQSASPEGSASLRPSELTRRICLSNLPKAFDHHFRSMADLASCVTPLLKRRTGSTGILNLSSITYAFRPRLRVRLTLGGRTFPRKPWDYGGRDSCPTFRYSCPHNHFHALQVRLPSPFDAHGTLLYQSPRG
jgi:hypothetical protein